MSDTQIDRVLDTPCKFKGLADRGGVNPIHSICEIHGIIMVFGGGTGQ
ncbi:hypothetical protein LEP1GSC195_1898 [Leptospira wolbachii serovar Codice str. CDC]|uniref:Uncharacterized protein n=1 Tax=Leptospira wolbachii serovar Codice str. CDC TaxID=1218599 RepID=R8ZYS9_9LEPT|nr:hypothetical protein LEP1GSC195_1898 [Leptospira wolbachii serovar Codice str. CDC]